MPLNPSKQDAHVLIVSRQALRLNAVQLGAAEQFTALKVDDTKLMVWKMPSTSPESNFVFSDCWKYKEELNEGDCRAMTGNVTLAAAP